MTDDKEHVSYHDIMIFHRIDLMQLTKPQCSVIKVDLRAH